MPAPQRAPELHSNLRLRIEQARARTDALFALLPPESLWERPIPERHRLIFYLGHLEAFDWNLLAPRFGMSPASPQLDRLFAFGIDPVGGGLPADVPADWPSLPEIERYNRGVRALLDEKLESSVAWPSGDGALRDGTLLHVAIEHRLMHAETLAYLLHNLPFDRKPAHPPPLADHTPAPSPRQAEIPAGIAVLGQPRGNPHSFGWDNEFDAHCMFVPAFAIDAFPVTNAQFLGFVQSGGYEQHEHWNPQDWEWKQRAEISHPHFWRPGHGASPSDPAAHWTLRAMFGEIPLPLSWPVYVSHAEAAAFARWAGRALPTEAQWHRAAYGSPGGTPREYPWGNAAPDPARGNFHHQRWDAAPVGAHPAGASAFGAFDLLGNGWEWTSTPFAPLRGFEPFSFYPGYSANFFDGRHFVMKGGSPRTDLCMLRPSFRNWFQPHYPYVYATFRCVEE